MFFLTDLISFLDDMVVLLLIYLGEILNTSPKIGLLIFGELTIFLWVDYDLGLLFSTDVLIGFENGCVNVLS